jgi:hypothetical protein
MGGGQNHLISAKDVAEMDITTKNVVKYLSMHYLRHLRHLKNNYKYYKSIKEGIMKNLPAVISTAIQAQKINLSECNIILPTQSFGDILGEFDKVSMEVVKINSNPAEGEVYIMNGKKALGKIPLQKISNALGIKWDPLNTTTILSTWNKAIAKATGAIKKPNGEWILMSEEKTIDVTVYEEEQEEIIREKAEKGNPDNILEWKTTNTGKKYPIFAAWESGEEKEAWIDRAIKKTVRQYRKFKDERARTGAKERVIRALLAIKNSYTDEELSKPFAFPRITTNVDAMLKTPALRDKAIENMTGASNAIFGNGKKEEPVNVTVPDITEGGKEAPKIEQGIEEPAEVPVDPLAEVYVFYDHLQADQRVPEKTRDFAATMLRETDPEVLFKYRDAIIEKYPALKEEALDENY